jgi:hypothetical protein
MNGALIPCGAEFIHWDTDETSFTRISFGFGAAAMRAISSIIPIGIPVGRANADELTHNIATTANVPLLEFTGFISTCPSSSDVPLEGRDPLEQPLGQAFFASFDAVFELTPIDCLSL